MKLINRDELREKLARDDEFNLVMTLSAHAYGAKRLPRSLHFETVEEALVALDPAEETIVYCADVHCAASIYAYRLLERAGFTKVRRYAGGVADWEEAGYPLERGALDPRIGRSDEKGLPSREPTRSRLPRRSWGICPSAAARVS